MIVFFASSVFQAVAADAPNSDPSGIWHARVKNPSGEWIAFKLEVSRDPSGTGVTGALVNDTDRTPSTSGRFEGGTLRLHFDFYDAVLTARLANGKLNGTFVRQWEQTTLTRDLVAEWAANTTQPARVSSDLSGEWVMKVGDPPQQRSWRAAFKTENGRATGTIIPVSGDWGSLEGTLSPGGVLTLNRFDGINSRVFKATLQPDGTLNGFVDLGLYDPIRKVVAERRRASDSAQTAALPDPETHTRMSSADEPFRFSFPDLNGQTVSWNDERFKGKVVILTIMGTWCPTCHEEAPFLQELYARYRERGLEIAGLAFEYTGNAERDRRQLGIFAKRHGLRYPLLLGGSTKDAPEKLPQLVNFGAYPTTLYIGRDRLVKRIHAGFEGKAAGERSVQLKKEIEVFIKALL